MAFRTWIYYIKEAFCSIFRNSWMSMASIGVVAVTLFILGSFMLLNINVDHLTDEIKNQVEIIAYVEEDTPADEVDELRVAIIQLTDVEEVRFVSKDEALERLREKLGEMVEGYGEGRRNPLRDSFEIRTIIPEDIPAVAALLQSMPGIARVNYGAEVVESLFIFTGVLKWIGIAFMLGLALTAAFLIANTIKLTVNARAGEIMIMKYVGATEWFIRWPFVIEGILLGSIGALIPKLILSYLYAQTVSWAQFNLIFLPLVSPELIMGQMSTIMLTIGTVIGCLGSLVSMRRFLKV
ncbi:MAG: permease-like cell division protein FtsX [Dethiobacter sp.]|jgi:cell division transport system permease protein|nr:permease-like cell division protein FtsX [Dethiobacter sp.]